MRDFMRKGESAPVHDTFPLTVVPMQLACSGLQLKSSAERSFVQLQAVVVSSGSPCTKLFPIRGILQVKYMRRGNEGGEKISSDVVRMRKR